MQIFSKVPSFNFMGRRLPAIIVSGILLLISIISLSVQGLNFGLDFTGGTLIEVKYKTAPDLNAIRDELKNSGFNDPILQHFGTTQDIIIRLAPIGEMSSAELSNQVIELLRKPYNETLTESSIEGAQKCISGQSLEVIECFIQVRRVEFVGPQVGEELAENGGLAMIYAMFGILVYVAFRFEYRFAIGSVAAIFHDVLIILGLFSIFRLDFDLTVLAALLAIIGYSLNDTIVVYDRIRENFRKMRKGTAIEIVNNSLNQTLSRTIMTSFTTIIVLIALFVFGGELIRYFSLALIMGIVVGTYSSIYIASSAALLLGVSKNDLMEVQKEGVELDNQP